MFDGGFGFGWMEGGRKGLGFGRGLGFNIFIIMIVEYFYFILFSGW